jgi:hypothetical protein
MSRSVREIPPRQNAVGPAFRCSEGRRLGAGLRGCCPSVTAGASAICRLHEFPPLLPNPP